MKNKSYNRLLLVQFLRVKKRNCNNSTRLYNNGPNHWYSLNGILPWVDYRSAVFIGNAIRRKSPIFAFVLVLQA